MADVKQYGLSGLSSDVELGEGGPRIVANTGNVEFRDPAGSNLVKVIGLAGSGPDDFVTFTQLGTKQDTLVSGTNIKTVGGISILGSGNIPVGTGTVTSVAATGTSEQIVVTGSPITGAGTLTLSLAPNAVLPGTEGMVPPSGTTAQRSPFPVAGETRYNSTLQDQETYLNGQWLPYGVVLQVQRTDVPQGSITGQIPFDNTPPLSTEGSLIASIVVTPKLTTSTLTVDLNIMTDAANNNRNCILAFFAGTTLLGVNAVNVGNAGRPQTLGLKVAFVPGSLAPITITARLGQNGAGTTYINRAAGATFGGTNTTQMTVTETK